jgi:AcrR family transcriptional regulator
LILQKAENKNDQTGDERLMGTQTVIELKPNKHQLRAKQTRELLLKSAEIVFVRDGYLGAELGEIATLAGRSKGAIYGHFKSKEDLYFALLEERTSGYRERVEAALVGCKSSKEISRALVDHFFGAVKEDKAWCRLLLEFKLFAVRNHSAKKRLQKINKNLYYREHLKDLPEPWASLGRRKPNGRSVLGPQAALASMAAIVPALSLEEEFGPDVLIQTKMKDVITSLVEALLIDGSNVASAAEILLPGLSQDAVNARTIANRSMVTAQIKRRSQRNKV